MIRIGKKVISPDKLFATLNEVLQARARGATQAEAAREVGVSRSFISNLESLGEVRHGARVAMIAFPVANGEEVRALAEEFSLDFVLTFSQSERSRAELGEARDMLNHLLDTLVELTDYSTVVVLASDLRIKTLKRILDSDVIGIELGKSPLNDDVIVDIEQLRSVVSGIIESVRDEYSAGRANERERGRRVRKAWDQLKRQ